MRIASAAEMAAIDRTATEQFGIPELELMENAGQAAYQLLCSNFSAELAGGVLVLVGTGNNGGDGLVVARLLAAAGVRVALLLLGESARLKGSALANFARLPKDGLTIDSLPATGIQGAQTLLDQHQLVIDALFGTGLKRPIVGTTAELIELVNSSNRKVVSLDIPSGVCADSGAILGAAISSETTITFGTPKWGNLLYPGRRLQNNLYLNEISFPQELLTSEKIQAEVNHPIALPPRDPAGHKGSFGKALVIGGSDRYRGAPQLAARAYMRAGGGMVFIAAPRSIIPSIAKELLESVVEPLPESPAGTLGFSSLETLLVNIEKVDQVILGPGLGLSADTEALVPELIKRCNKALVLDGDALTIVAKHKDLLRARQAPTILTPHPGEFARLISLPIEKIAADPQAALRQLTAEAGCITVLKGASTLIGDPSGQIFLNLTGNSGMGSAGMGDTLTGIIAACLTSGLLPLSATRSAVWLHGRAGDLAAYGPAAKANLTPKADQNGNIPIFTSRQAQPPTTDNAFPTESQPLGEHGLLAHDLAERIPQAILELV